MTQLLHLVFVFTPAANLVTDEFSCQSDEFKSQSDEFNSQRDEFICQQDKFICQRDEVNCQKDEFNCQNLYDTNIELHNFCASMQIHARLLISGTHMYIIIAICWQNAYTCSQKTIP